MKLHQFCFVISLTTVWFLLHYLHSQYFLGKGITWFRICMFECFCYVMFKILPTYSEFQKAIKVYCDRS